VRGDVDEYDRITATREADLVAAIVDAEARSAAVRSGSDGSSDSDFGGGCSGDGGGGGSW
jgi:hypothetical protein